MKNNFKFFTKAIIGSALGALLLAGVIVASGQNSDLYAYYSNGSYVNSAVKSDPADQNDALKVAVRNGYAQGHEVGKGAREYDQPFDFKNDSLFEKADYGYDAAVGVSRDEYQKYFRQGFKFGYNDGYNNRTKYGTKDGDKVAILDSVVDSIISGKKS